MKKIIVYSDATWTNPRAMSIKKIVRNAIWMIRFKCNWDWNWVILLSNDKEQCANFMSAGVLSITNVTVKNTQTNKFLSNKNVLFTYLRRFIVQIIVLNLASYKIHKDFRCLFYFLEIFILLNNFYEVDFILKKSWRGTPLNIGTTIDKSVSQINRLKVGSINGLKILQLEWAKLSTKLATNCEMGFVWWIRTLKSEIWLVTAALLMAI